MHPLRLRHKRLAWYVEAPSLVVGYVVFGLVRAAADRGDPAATANALKVQRVEEVLRIAVEVPFNHLLLGHPVAIHVIGYFYRLSVLAVPAVLIWLYRKHPAHYHRLLTVLVAIMLADILIVWAFPVAPPRFALPGVVDHMVVHDVLFSAATSVPRPGASVSAAMPSMHIAWTTWCAYAVWSSLRGTRPRTALAAFAYPLLTAVVVLVTGHHYVLDIAAGMTLVAVAALVVGRVRARRGRVGEVV